MTTKPAWREHFLTFPELKAEGVMLSRSRLVRLQGTRLFPRPFLRPGEPAYFLKSEIAEWVRRRRVLAAEVSAAAAEAELEEQEAA